jgi:UMP-CMP kinase
MQHLSAGELLREEIASGSSTGQTIASIINEGKIVPVQISLDLIRNKIESIPCNRFLVDGFPRNWDNVQGWDSCMTEVCDVEGVMFIDCPEAELEKRLLSRGQTSGRSDDNIATAHKRFATFKEATMPIVEHFASQNKLMRVAGDQPVEAVFHDLKRHVTPFIENEILHLTGVLLDAIAAKDWDTYATMVDPSLTCFEKEARGNLVEGLEFHKYYFDQQSSSSSSSSGSSSKTVTSTSASASASAQLIASRPTVRSMGKSAVINFVRTMPSGERFEESRVWQLSGGAWRLVHFHRGPAPPL